jgi:hypothetical protein
MSTRNLPRGKGWQARQADNLTAICELLPKENVGGSTSHNPLVLHGLLQIALPFLSILLKALNTMSKQEHH